MTDDLVTRLRDAVNGEHDMTPHGADCLQAAARIESDAATIARLEGERDDCAIYLKDGETPRQRMDRDHADGLALMGLLAKEKARVEAAEAKVAALVEALEWIISLNDQAECCGKDYAECCNQPEYGLDRAQRVARNARAAIAAAKDKKQTL